MASHSLTRNRGSPNETLPVAASLCFAAGVPHPGALRDGSGGGGEEQKDLRGRHQHQARGGAAGQRDLVPAWQLHRLSRCTASPSPVEGVVAQGARGPPGFEQELVIYL